MTKSQEIADHVRESIVTGRIRPHEFLRMEHLAAELDASVTPVREALIQLATEGFVHQRPRRGFEVLAVTDDDLRDLYLAQAWLAGELAARATRNLSQRDIDELEALQDELVAAAERGEPDRVEQLNHEFHRRINRAAESPRLAGLLRRSAQYAPRLFFSQIEGWSHASAHDHRAVIAALRAVDAEAARVAMSHHIEEAGALLIDHRRTPHRPVDPADHR